MNGLESEPQLHQDETASASSTHDDSNKLFLGDNGELALDTRRVLVQLLVGPSVDGRRHPKLWPIVVRDESIVRRRLAELFLELVLDHTLQVAFTRQADAGELEVPRLLRRAQLTFVESVLLLFLRQRLAQADAHGDRAVVSTAEILEHLKLYERNTCTDRFGFEKRIHAAIEKIKKHSILQKIRSSDERYEIAPTLKLLFSVDEIVALTELYRRMASGEAIAFENTPEADKEEMP